MSHQLRRVIAINIRNSATGLPSGHISELDPRGGVLAVGANGAGKTTLLRMIPLFYGATPQQILKGSGNSSLIWYTLPDPSSCMVFEYERESSDDLRCVVVHARPDQDAPQFHIIQGGYEERFFVDESDLFVTRDEFKARVEAMGVVVERKLFLHQYRSVILNEKLETKDGKEMRHLAARHSISPTPLRNLDQIAAAMANEKISFRDLTNIVIERVTDTEHDTGSAASVRELKQSREAVTKWLQSRDHIAAVMAMQPEAERLMGRVNTIKALHRKLCALHVAAKQAIKQAQNQRAELGAEQKRINEHYTQESERLEGIDTALSAQKTAAQEQIGALEKHVDDAKKRQKHFDEIGVSDMDKEQQQEGALSAQLRQLQEQHLQITSKAGDANTRYEASKLAIEQSAAGQRELIGKRRTAVVDEYSRKLEQIRLAEQAAVQSFRQPARLQEIDAARLELAGQIATAAEQARNPAASDEAIQRLNDATAEVGRLREADRAADAARTEAARAQEAARMTHDANLARVNALQADLDVARSRSQELLARLNPQDGSLLAYLRSQDPQLWEQASRILDPGLLERTDLEPAIDEELALSGSRLALGALTLNAAAIEEPGWVDAQTLKDELARHQQAVQALEQQHADAKRTAGKSDSSHKEAQARLAKAQADEAMAATALKSSLQAETHAKERVQREKDEAREQAKRAHEDLTRRQKDLEQEAGRIKAAAAADLQQIHQGFETQRRQANEWRDEQTKGLDTEEQSIGVRQKDELEALAADLKNELEGLGVDSQQVQGLETSIAKLQTRLRSIADNRHEVESWRAFSADVLPGLAAKEMELERGIEVIRGLGNRITENTRAREDLDRVTNARLRDIAGLWTTSENDEASLNNLIERTLGKFRDHVSADAIETQWNIHQIQQEAAQAVADLGSENDRAHSEARKLRSEMARHEGGPADWLALKERDLPDPQTLLEHEVTCEHARLICSWFEPMEHGQYLNQLNKEMMAFMDAAGSFLSTLDRFDRRVDSFNRKLQTALSRINGFERIKNLEVQVRSMVSQIGYLKTLRSMQDVAGARSSTLASFTTMQRELPSAENAALIRAFRDILQNDVGFRVNLGEMVRLECSVVENGKRKVITNEEEFKGVSSTGLTALIVAMFLMGFVQMIRGDSPVRLVWIADEAAKFDAQNLGTYLQTLADNRIDLISAAPSIDPTLARHYKSISVFDVDGQVVTNFLHKKEAQHVAA